jgi:MFS family permease
MVSAAPQGSTATATRLASIAALGGFLFGYDSAVINGAVKAIGDHYHVAATGLGFTVSSALLGAAGGAVVAGRVADRFGRLHAMWLAAVLFLISAVGTGLVDTLGLLIVFRVVGGVGVGVASVIAPAYIAEIAPAKSRGRLGSVQQLAIVLGIFIALLVNYVLASTAGGSEKTLALGLPAWRWMFLAMTAPALLYGGLSLTIPESPRYLVLRGRLEDARRVFRRVLGGAAGPIALVAANAFVFFFAMSWGPVVWVMLGEKFPNHIRAAALSVAASTQWIANWAISTSFPSLKNVGLGVAYGLYAAFALLSFIFVRRLVAETKGQELEEMPQELRVPTTQGVRPGRPQFEH